MKTKFLLLLSFCFIYANAQEIKYWDLQEMVDYAATNNLTIQQSQINNTLQENQITAAKRQRLPTVGAQVGNSVIVGVAGIPISNSNQVVNLTNGYYIYQNQLGLNANWEFFNKGFYNLNEDKAKIDFDASQFSLQDLVNDISLDIVNRYLTILLNKEILGISQEQVLFSEQQVQRSQILFDNGALAKSQLVEAEASLAQDQQTLATSKIDVEQARFNLSQVLQLDDYTKFDVQTIQIPKELTPNLIDLDEILLFAKQNQPNIKSAALKVESAEKDIEIAKTDFWPTMSLSYNFGTNYRDYFNEGIPADAMFHQWWDNQTHTLGMNINIPIFNKNLTKLNVENAKISQQLAEKSLELEEQSLKQDIQLAYFQVNTTFEQFKASEEAVRAAEISLEYTQKSYDAGRSTIYDLNQSRNNLFRAKSQMLQAKYNYVFRLKVLDFYAGKPLTFN